jgi:hypothetical protein
MGQGLYKIVLCRFSRKEVKYYPETLAGYVFQGLLLQCLPVKDFRVIYNNLTKTEILLFLIHT